MPLFCDGFDWPFGDEVARQASVGLPVPWFDANAYARHYNMAKAGDPPIWAWHTGMDANMPKNADANMPLYAMANGDVIFAGQWPSGSWGNLVVIRHTWENGTVVYSRTAHGLKVIVRAGQSVTRGQQICSVGDANGRWSHHAHIDISHTKVLEANPGHWTYDNEALMRANYVPPIKYIQEHRPNGVPTPMPEPIATTLYVQPTGGLRLRAAPNGTVLKVIPQNTEVRGFETQTIGAITWQRVTFNSAAGWMGAREGAPTGVVTAIYLAPTKVGLPPIPTGPTPYDGKNALWFHHPAAANITALLIDLPDSVGAIIVKTSDGARWQGQSAGATAIDIGSIEDVEKWVDAAAFGLDFHAWAVLQGFDVDGEAQRLIDVANVPGVRSIVLDIEPYEQFWKGPRSAVAAIMSKVRANIPAGFHIGLSIDPRPQHVAGIYADEWKPFVDSVHPQCYWVTFEQEPGEVLRSAYATWAGFGKPIIPVLQGNADPSDIELAIDTVRSVYHAAGLSFWRYGVMDAAQLAAMGDVAAPPPAPEPMEILETTDSLNVRAGAGIDKAIVGALRKGTTVTASGHFKGAGADDWATVHTPIKGFAARDFMKEPAIIVPPPEPTTRTMFVWSKPYSHIRSEPRKSAPAVGSALYGAQFSVDVATIEDGDHVWGRIEEGKYIALREIDGSPIYLDTTAPPPLPSGHPKFGFFIHEDSEDANTVHGQVLQMARDGDLGCVEVLNNVGLANHFAQLGVRTSIRFATGVGNGMTATFGDDRDYHPGRNWFKPEDYGLIDERVWIKPWGVNEQNHLTDGIFWRGIFDRAVEVGRWKVCGFCDGVGHPADFNESAPKSGRYVSAAWDLRVSSGAMRVGKAHGFTLYYNGYGRMEHLYSPNGDYVGAKETPDPGSGLWFDQGGNIIRRDDGAWFWYGGRALSVYYAIKPNGKPLIPEDSRMDIVYGEARSSDAIYRGPQEIIDDAHGYDIRTAGDPHFKGYNIWQIGRGYIFAYSAADRGVPEIARARRGVR